MNKIKIIFTVLLCVSLLALCACKNENNNSNQDSVPGNTPTVNTDPTTATSGSQNNSGGSAFDDVDWESPIDVDENAETLPPVTQNPTEPDATVPAVTEPNATEPNATEPAATAPGETEPPVVETNPVDPTDPPVVINPDGSIVLPFIPG